MMAMRSVGVVEALAAQRQYRGLNCAENAFGRSFPQR